MRGDKLRQAGREVGAATLKWGGAHLAAGERLPHSPFRWPANCTMIRQMLVQNGGFHAVQNDL